MPQKLALLVGANPRVVISGPKVKLYDGLWKLSAQGLEITTLAFERVDAISLSATILDKHTCDGAICIKGDCTIQVHIDKRGSEELVNAYAELVE